MNKAFKIILYTMVVLFSFQVAEAQKKRKNRKQDNSKECPTYTENLSNDLPVYEKPDFAEGEVIQTEKAELRDDSHKVDSVVSVLQDYYENKTKAKGWRIQVWTGQNHIQMSAATEKYKSNYMDLDLPIHEDYDKTFFRLKIGDFIDRLAAYKALMKIKVQFPNALLVPDEVDLGN